MKIGHYWSCILIFSWIMAYNIMLWWLAYLTQPATYDSMWIPGELWSGFEGGVIKVWPWEAIEKSLSKGSDIVERSYMDLRSLVNVGGVCALPAADIKYLLSDHCRSKMWSGGYQTFALWYASHFLYTNPLLLIHIFLCPSFLISLYKTFHLLSFYSTGILVQKNFWKFSP